MIPKQRILGASLAALLSFQTADAATTPATAPANYLPNLSQKILEEFKKPEYAVSRCALSPVFASDSMSVAVSEDRTFAAGDLVVEVGNEPLDTSSKTPVRDLLMKHGAAETVPVKIRRADKELVVTAKCSDAKPVNDLLLEAAFAASKNDAVTCADKMNSARQLHAMAFPIMFLAFQCNRIAGRITTPGDLARGYYDAYRMMVLANVWSPDALGRIRGDVLSAVDVLKKSNATLLADDLKQQYDQALTAKSQPATASVAQ
jgi:hypothetical protein